MVGYGPPTKHEHPEEQRSRTRLDLGKPDFQEKANSNLGQEGVLQIAQEPRVLRCPGDVDSV